MSPLSPRQLADARTPLSRSQPFLLPHSTCGDEPQLSPSRLSTSSSSAVSSSTLSSLVRRSQSASRRGSSTRTRISSHASGAAPSLHLHTKANAHAPAGPHLVPLATGQTGLGKSTLINTLFASHLVESKGRLAADEQVRSTTEILANSHGAYRNERERVNPGNQGEDDERERRAWGSRRQSGRGAGSCALSSWLGRSKR